MIHVGEFMQSFSLTFVASLCCALLLRLVVDLARGFSAHCVRCRTK
jgi:hypothetical protein